MKSQYSSSIARQKSCLIFIISLYSNKMSQNPSISNCKYHYTPNNLVIKDQGVLTLRCSICYTQCIENIHSHKQQSLTKQMQRPVILNSKSKSFFLEWSQQLIKTLTQAQYSNGPLEYITNFAFILSQNHNLIKAHKEQLNKIFSQVLIQQKDIFKGNIDFVQDLSPSELTVDLFLADLYNMVAQKAEDSLSIVIVKFQSLFKQHAHHLEMKDWIEKLQKLQFNTNFWRRLIQSKEKVMNKYQNDIFFNVAPMREHIKKQSSKVPQIQKSPSIMTESIDSSQQSSSALKESTAIDRRAIVEDQAYSNVRKIVIDVQSPIKKLETPAQTPKNREDKQIKNQSPSLNWQNDRTKSKQSTASGKKNDLLQSEIHNKIIKEQNQISQDLQSSKNLVNANANHSQNIVKLSEIIKVLNLQNKKLKNWREGVVAETTNFNKKIREITGLVQVLREIHKQEKQTPQIDVEEEKMVNLLIEQYRQLISKHESTIQQLFSVKKQKSAISKQNKILKHQVEQLSARVKQHQKIQERLSENTRQLQVLKGSIEQLNERIKEYKHRIVNLKNENEAIRQGEIEKFLTTQRQIEELTKINTQYLSMTKQKSKMIQQMQEKYAKQKESVRELMQRQLKQKEQALQEQKNNWEQKNRDRSKQCEDEKQKNKCDEQNNINEAIRLNSKLKEELKAQKQKVLQALEITRELARLDGLKQEQIAELKEQLGKSQSQIQKISNNLNIAEKLIKQFGKEDQNQILGPTTLHDVKQAGNQFLIANTGSKQNESMSEIKQGELESRICNLEKIVRQLEQQLRVENNSYNDSLIEDLIQTESEVKAKQFQISKFISLIEELLTRLPEEEKKKYQQKLNILHL